ncbi:mechanosensitive ion channel family protein [Nonlabens sp. SY33080]|uniref:mechanosensitive ion channel family protein n=1 Tax=Nonlabens sp. SY33080 TaxID=2719911 RepID=UPI001428C9C2|nr:mechanosensitive ion channel domain-containing protein [Nonlabens sp. SY33080]
MLKTGFHRFLLFGLLVFSILGNSQEKEAEPTRDFPKLSDTISEAGTYQSNPIGAYNEAFYIVNRLNENIGLPPNHLNFQTPQATLEQFISSCRNNNFEEAGYALNLNLFPKEVTKKEAAILAEKFYFVLNQRVKIDWNNISDRPDGQIDITTSTNGAIAGNPRRSVVFGEVDLNNRDVVLRIQRVKLDDYGAFWMIASNTVENIEPLYEEYGPRKLDRIMPQWARVSFLGFPVWKFLATILLFFMAYAVGRVFSYVTRRLLLKSDRAWLRTTANKLAKPAGIALSMLFFYIILNKLISFSGPYSSTIYAILLVLVIASIAWLLMSFINAVMTYIAEHKIGDSSIEENTQARMMMTYISVARRLLTIIIIFVAISVVLSQFRSLEKLGISLLASAGLITIILGVAAQNTLGNIIAGIQIALTRPCKIGDTLYIGDEWCYVEDIRFTYMVTRTWDSRRLIIPLKDIISKPFQNWSMTNAHRLQPIVVYADYNTDVQLVREKFSELLKQEEEYDEEHPPVVQVTEVTEKAIAIRALCSAQDANSAWELHCKLREELVKFIAQLNDGKHLSKERILIQKEST